MPALRPLAARLGLAAVVVAALALAYALFPRPDALPRSERSVFLEGARRTCAQRIEAATELDLDATARTRYCECVARELSRAVTREEIERLRETRELPASLEEKSLASSATCWLELSPSVP